MACVILAGGEGKRMASRDWHKVCFPVAGRPAIVRALDTYKSAGLRNFLVVVGQMAGQVLATVAEAHPDVSFVYQAEPRGTGHAARVAVRALEARGHRGPVLVTMGDKVTRREVVSGLLERFEASGPDALVTVLPLSSDSTAGRVVTARGGEVLGVIELADLDRARRSRGRVQIGDERLTARQVERRAAGVNPSLYVFRFEALGEALEGLRADNVQGELYLTDTVAHVAARGRVETYHLDDPTDLMAFNTPGELLAAEKVVREREKPARVSPGRKRRLTPRELRPAGEWGKTLAEPDGRLTRALRRIYGRDETLIRERVDAMRTLVEGFAERFGPDREMILCRAPGRVNLMGRHVDHRGGFVNVMAISRETLVAAAPRDDDVFTLRNLDAGRFPDRAFRLLDLLEAFSWAEWMEFLGSQVARNVLQRAPGDWSHYARAPLLRLQHECRDVRLRGMDCLVTGNIPMGAGLSSSSALVVAFAEAAVALNGLDVAMRDFVDLCGEGEWFVGSRGGSADHAAIRTSRAGAVSRIGFFPFRLAGEVRFPPHVRVVIAHSGSEAVKSAGARDTFNQRVASYEIAQMFLRRDWPAAAAMEHLRDLDPDKLGVQPADLYRALKLLPVHPSRGRVRKELSGPDTGRVEELFTTHRNLGVYDLRGAALFGVAECVRSERFADVLEAGQFEAVGAMMAASHDGDRIVRFDANGRLRRHVVRTSDAALDRLAASNAALVGQSGRYACSTEAIDRLVDLTGRCEGVLGAQLAGAGLGGCMMILVAEGALDSLLGCLENEFYGPRGLEPAAHACTPVAGAGLLRT